MKYSLANKEFKKRNNIFGERRHHNIIDEYGQQPLDCVQQLGEDLEDSSLQVDHEKDRRRESIYQYIDFGNSKHEEGKQTITFNSSLHKNKESKPGRHRLSPNIPPTLPIIRTAPPISSISTKAKPIVKRPLKLESNLVEFSYFSDQTQIKFAQIKQVIGKLFMILKKNNEKVAYLQKLLYLTASRDQKMLREMNYCLAHSIGLEGKVDLFLNTMRNVYQNLRISRLKQQNIELYIKQALKTEPSLKPTNITPQNKIQPLSSHHQSYKQTQELMSLLQYQSESSFVQPYLIKQTQEKSKQILKSAEKNNNYILNEPTVEIHRKSFKVGEVFMAKQTIKNDLQDFYKLSPFQANRLISHIGKKQQALNETPKIKEAAKTSQIRQKGESPKSNWSYSFQINQYDKVRNWCDKRGQENMACWLDDMGCLRRPNMTYIFWPNGEVMRISQNVFLLLQDEGYIQNCKLKS